MVIFLAKKTIFGKLRKFKRAKEDEGRLLEVREIASVRKVKSGSLSSPRKQFGADETTGTFFYKESSWIREFQYNRETRVLKMILKTGKVYEWDNVSPFIAAKCLAGDAAAHTYDESGDNRWYPHKHPSLGAAFWEYLSTKSRRDFEAESQEEAWTREGKAQIVRLSREEVLARRGRSTREARS